MKTKLFFLVAVPLVLNGAISMGEEPTFLPDAEIVKMLEEPSSSFEREICLKNNAYFQMIPLTDENEGLWGGLALYPFLSQPKDQRYVIRFLRTERTPRFGCSRKNTAC